MAAPAFAAADLPDPADADPTDAADPADPADPAGDPFDVCGAGIVVVVVVVTIGAMSMATGGTETGGADRGRLGDNATVATRAGLVADMRDGSAL